MFCSSAPFARMLAAEVKFINFYCARELFPLRAYRATSEFVKPTPGSAIALKTQKLLQGNGINA
jgi:hypothetical protein